MEPILRRDGQNFFRIFIEKEKNFDMEHIVENLDNTFSEFSSKGNNVDMENIERQSRQYTYNISRQKK